MTANKIRTLILCGLALPMTVFASDTTDHTDHTDRDQAKVRAARLAARADAKMQERMQQKIQVQVEFAMRNAERDMQNAQVVLARSMRQAREMNVNAIVTKIGDCTQRLKIEQNAKGGQLSTVLQPLSMQGAALFNDGNKSFTYWPDQRIVIECDSDSERIQDIEARSELAAQNYNLRIERSGRPVAGRAAICIYADPKVPGLPSRQFYLDQQTLYPLRLMQENEGQWKMTLDTQVVNFPKDMPEINLNLVGTPRRVRLDPAQRLAGITDCKDRLGFDPIVPKHLPSGFQVQRAELRRNQDGQLAMLWLTDGLATARVYEFRCNQMREGIWSQGSSTVLTEDGVTMTLVSDLQSNIRRRLLQAFAHRTPVSIPPPAGGATVSFGVKAPPVPSQEPANPRPMFGIPEPEPGIIKGSLAPSADSDAISQANNVKGE
jgi:hypothetical protein